MMAMTTKIRKLLMKRLWNSRASVSVSPDRELLSLSMAMIDLR
jgi:hypothetical protein